MIDGSGYGDGSGDGYAYADALREKLVAVSLETLKLAIAVKEPGK